MSARPVPTSAATTPSSTPASSLTAAEFWSKYWPFFACPAVALVQYLILLLVLPAIWENHAEPGKVGFGLFVLAAVGAGGHCAVLGIRSVQSEDRRSSEREAQAAACSGDVGRLRASHDHTVRLLTAEKHSLTTQNEHLRKDHAVAHQHRADALIDAERVRVQTIKDRLDRELNDARAALGSQLTAVRDEREQAQTRLQAELELSQTKHREELDRCQVAHHAEMKKLTEAMQQQVRAQNAEYKTQLDALAARHGEIVDNFRVSGQQDAEAKIEALTRVTFEQARRDRLAACQRVERRYAELAAQVTEALPAPAFIAWLDQWFPNSPSAFFPYTPLADRAVDHLDRLAVHADIREAFRREQPRLGGVYTAEVVERYIADHLNDSVPLDEIRKLAPEYIAALEGTAGRLDDRTRPEREQREHQSVLRQKMTAEIEVARRETARLKDVHPADELAAALAERVADIQSQYRAQGVAV